MKAAATQVIVWDGIEYQRIRSGRYAAVAVRIQGPEWVRRYRRWSLLIEFELLGDSKATRVCAFFNLGNDPSGPKPGRQSRYFRAWSIANGEQPKSGRPMDPNIFRDGQVYTIEVEESRKDSEENDKPEVEVYSKVTKIIAVEWPSKEVRNL